MSICTCSRCYQPIDSDEDLDCFVPFNGVLKAVCESCRQELRVEPDPNDFNHTEGNHEST